jgi:hypothetical protein
MDHLHESRGPVKGETSSEYEADLFGFKKHNSTIIEPRDKRLSQYPAHAGWKSPESKPAAIAIEPYAKTLRGRALAEFRYCYPRGLTADQLGRLVGAGPLSMRPRLSELRSSGLIEATPERRKNDSGIGAIVWRATAQAMGGR